MVFCNKNYNLLSFSSFFLVLHVFYVVAKLTCMLLHMYNTHCTKFFMLHLTNPVLLNIVTSSV